MRSNVLALARVWGEKPQGLSTQACFGKSQNSLAEHMKLCLQGVVCYTLPNNLLILLGGAPMSFAVLHMQKLKQNAIKGIQFHNQRERESHTNPDIDADRSHLNYDLVNLEPVDYNKKINERISEGVTTGKAIRKDAVKVASFMITSDKGFFDKLDESKERDYFKSAYDFFSSRYGKENLVYASVHKDEKTPHMHLGFVPITEDGRLSAKDFFGKKLQLVKLQDDYYSHMKESGFDLERGLSSDKKHLETTKFKHETLRKEIQDMEKRLLIMKDTEEQIKAIEELPEPKKAMGHFLVKSEDYDTLKQHALEGAELKFENGNLKAQLETTIKENESLKEDLQNAQTNVRNKYKRLDQDLEIMGKDIEGHAQKLADKMESEKYNKLVNDYNNLSKDKKELFDLAKERIENKNNEIQQLKTDLNTYKQENTIYRKENSELKSENKSLNGIIDKLKTELLNTKQLVQKALEKYTGYVKTWISFSPHKQALEDFSKRSDDFEKNSIKIAEKELTRDFEDEIEK
jgi:DNA repair exonuclease SbcCD ATPase subunit